MAIDIAVLEKGYFYFDKPVPYKLSDTAHIDITPISVYDSEVFLSSCDILQIVAVMTALYIASMFAYQCHNEP